MILDRLFPVKPAQTAGRALYAALVEQSRTPALYESFGVPDTAEGRFEIYTLHLVLLVDRLRGQGPRAGEVSQVLFDTYLQGLDDALRELGVGDLSVGKKMRKLGEAFYGRAKAYEEAFSALPDVSALNALIGRTVWDGADQERPGSLGRYVCGQREVLAGQDLDAVLSGQVTWGAAT